MNEWGCAVSEMAEAKTQGHTGPVVNPGPYEVEAGLSGYRRSNSGSP